MQLIHVLLPVVSGLILAQDTAPNIEPADSNSQPTLQRTFLLAGVRGPTGVTGVMGRIDHLAYDPATDRLFVAALENGSLEVIDLKKGERIKSIAGLKKPQGIAVVPDTGSVVVACGEDGVAHVYDTQTLEEKQHFTAGPGADNVRYDSQYHTVYITHRQEDSGVITVYDAKTLAVLRRISFLTRPESFQLDPAGNRLFANLPGGVRATADGSVAVVDRTSGDKLAQIDLPGRARNFPMAFDTAHERLFIVSRKPAKLILIDTRTYQVTAQADCAEDSDDLFYDAQNNQVVVIGGGYRPDLRLENEPIPAGTPDETGAIDIFSIDDQGQLHKIASTPTLPHARTGLFVANRRALYVAVPPQGERDSEIREYLIPGQK
ncbi:MAG: hypothetical protein HJJLKODD_01155 [Phycisphaerae bacterium]|nr:hypothetical protein [Phycisphaerae bacterium]